MQDLKVAKIIEFPIHGDKQVKLVAIEELKDCPFDVKRVYYIWDTLHDVVRGKHAHYDLKQVILCLKGSCDFILDDGTTRETVHLDDPSKGIYIDSFIWREFTNFSEDCVVLVLASELYNTDDYIYDYQEFLDKVHNKG